MEWGYGAHVCLGKNIALLEINKVVPQIFRSFSLRLANPKTDGWNCISSTFVVQKDFEIILERRSAN
jgi:cytochrome P450